jgi:hypothetical protein
LHVPQNALAAVGLVPAINGFTLWLTAVPGTPPGGNRFRKNMFGKTDMFGKTWR